jgi:hypothetical protein
MRDGVATAGADLGGRSLDERWSSSLLRMGDISDSMDGRMLVDAKSLFDKNQCKVFPKSQIVRR